MTKKKCGSRFLIKIVTTIAAYTAWVVLNMGSIISKNM